MDRKIEMDAGVNVFFYECHEKDTQVEKCVLHQRFLVEKGIEKRKKNVPLSQRNEKSLERLFSLPPPADEILGL